MRGEVTRNPIKGRQKASWGITLPASKPVTLEAYLSACLLGRMVEWILCEEVRRLWAGALCSACVLSFPDSPPPHYSPPFSGPALPSAGK